MTNARDLIMGSGSPAFSFNYPNDTVTGQILTEPKSVQQRNFGDGQPAFWPSGDPKMQVVFQIQTALRNYEGINNPDRARPDDGVRTIYLKGKHMEAATKQAILGAGASWLDVGGWVNFTYTGDDMTSKAGNKPKLFSVRYQPPAERPLPQPPAPIQGYTQGPGYQNQGFPAQRPPQPPTNTYVGQGSMPAWQQPGWSASPDGMAPPAPPVYPAQPAMPSHHGQADQIPAWAGGPSSAPPAPTSAPPAPALSTLDAIRAAQTSGTPDYGSVQPAF